MLRFGFPQSLICVEKELSEVDHLQKGPLPAKRRVDLLVFGKDIHPHYSLYPLLIVECKAKQITEEALSQVVGYNYYVRAYFVALAAEKEFKMVVVCNGERKTIEFLPRYEELVRAVKR